MVGPTFFHSLQFVTKRIITAFFKKRERERVDKRTLNNNNKKKPIKKW